MDRFKELQTEIATKEKQVEKATTANEEKMKKKDAQLKRVLRRELDVKKTVDEQKSIIKNLASIWKSRRIGQQYIRRKDQQRNLQLLEEAMKENEISTELYEVIAINNVRLSLHPGCKLPGNQAETCGMGAGGGNL